MMSGNRKIGILILVVLFGWGIGGCKEKKKVFLNEQQFTALLVDMHLADGTLQTKGYTTDKGKKDYTYYNSVFAKYGIDQAGFDSCMYYYSSQSALFSKMYDKVVDELSKRLTEQDRILNELKANDSLNYFPVTDTLLLDSLHKVYEFVIDSIIPGQYKFSATVKFDTLDKGINNRIHAYFLSEDGQDTLYTRKVKVFSDTLPHTYNWSQYVDSAYRRLVVRMVDTDKPEKLSYREGKIWDVTLFRPYISERTANRLKRALKSQPTFPVSKDKLIRKEFDKKK